MIEYAQKRPGRTTASARGFQFIYVAFIGLALFTTDSAADSVIVVVGAPGTEEYAQQFFEWADRWQKICNKADAEFHSVGMTEANLEDESKRTDRDS